MSNIKKARIIGEMAYDSLMNDKVMAKVGAMSFPSIGLTINFTGAERMVETVTGGMLALYAFEIEGEEAVRFDWFRDFVSEVEKDGGFFDYVKVVDTEAGGLTPSTWGYNSDPNRRRPTFHR